MIIQSHFRKTILGLDLTICILGCNRQQQYLKITSGKYWIAARTKQYYVQFGTIKIELTQRFKLPMSDGKICTQVNVYTEDDLQYWKDQALQTGHLMAFAYHCPKDAMGYSEPGHGKYMIFPPEMEHRVFLGHPQGVLVDLESENV